MKEMTVLAVDLGAESGRVMAIHFDGKRLRLEEIHRFLNIPVRVQGTIYWDILRLWDEIQIGIGRGKLYNPSSLGVDTWGVDFGLLDANGELIGNPVHYRDSRTDGVMAKVFKRVPRESIFNLTGTQFMPINTLFQLVSMVEVQSPQLDICSSFLMMPDLMNYFMTGEKVCEFTIATTTQMFDPRSGTWGMDMLAKLGIPTQIFPEIVMPGTRIGEYESIPVIAPACHDTGSAVASVPSQASNVAYISSGTWSLVGLEVKEPLLSSAALVANATNEGGVYNTFRLLTNVTGLWILQQCRATWADQGEEFSYTKLIEMAYKAPPLTSLINVNDPMFLPPGDHPLLVLKASQMTGQMVPSLKGAVVRCVLESLALKYREVLDTLCQLTGQEPKCIHIIGGGTQNEMLNQMTANATGLPVLAGPVEATAIGNALVQLITLGEMKDIKEARQIVAQMGTLKRYNPQKIQEWKSAYERYQKL